MGDNNILPKGGFLRGVLAGLTMISLIFIGLAMAFPLNVAISPTPAIVSELITAPAQPVVETEESSSDISLNTEPTIPIQPVINPSPLGVSAPDVAIAPETAAPVSIVSQIDAMPTNDIQIGGSASAPPSIVAPMVSSIEVPIAAETPTVEETTQAPVVSVDISAGENDTTTGPQTSQEVGSPVAVIENPTVINLAAKPSTGVNLAGQTLIKTAEPVLVDAVEQSEPNTAFGAYSAKFTDDGRKPLMSFILLVDTLDQAEVLTGFSNPVTLAVASDNPAANDIIASYRAAGGEVVLLLPTEGPNALRQGGSPSDVPAFLEATMANIEGVLGVMDGPDGNVNQNARMMSAILAELAQTGHAIMTVNGLGLNRTSILAQEAGVPATDISRAIDTSDGAFAIIKELDKLVLQIGDQRSFTIFAQATPDMLIALNFWLKSPKAESVTIAPVSASILRN
ncbi:MAG: divergent polysaccharide deacetylase family protein [Rhodobacteraceae bacterium]|nr:divergent polysaccharide deacetylase family protein [Paracoccaceae bacterium]